MTRVLLSTIAVALLLIAPQDPTGISGLIHPTASGGGGTVALVGAVTSCSAIASGANCTLAQATTAGDLLVFVPTVIAAAHTFSLVKAGAVSMTQVPSVVGSCGGASGDIWYGPNVAGSTTTVTLTDSGGSSWSGKVYEVSGANTSAPLDQHGLTTCGAGTSGPALTITAASEFIVAQELTNGSATAVGGGFTFDSPGFSGIAFAHLITTITGTYTPTWTTGSTNQGLAASFKP